MGLKIAICWNGFWFSFIWNTNIIRFCAHSEEAYLHNSSQNSLSPVSQLCSFHVPDHPAKQLAAAHGSVHSHTSDHFSFQVKWTIRFTAQRSTYWEAFPFPLSFRDVSGRGCRAAVVHFQVVPTYPAEPSVNQAWIFSSSTNWSYRTPHEATGAGWERKDRIAGAGPQGIWATSLCNLRVPSGPAQARSHVYTTYDDRVLLCTPNFMN